MTEKMMNLKVKVTLVEVSALRNDAVLNVQVGADGNMRNIGDYSLTVGNDMTALWPVEFFAWKDEDEAKEKVWQALKKIKENL